ncbi:hypothetical protein NQD34_015946 [Periophthalmus magnuspinnatus]|nr:hypothetical protein NQD34_015946 [Periophthalmus magnuspinnatus]
MDVTLSEMLGTFMESPLVMWVRTLGPLASGEEAGTEDRVNMFMELVDGVFLHKIMTQIDPSPTHQRLSKNINNDVALRLHNLTVLVRHIRTYYQRLPVVLPLSAQAVSCWLRAQTQGGAQETLQQLIVMPLPNILCIAKDPISAKSMEELKRLLLLILGCAVQCERKEEMIEKIKLLDIETQAAIVSHIQEVTHNQLNVLDLSWLEAESELVHEELEPMSRNMAGSLRQLIDQRDKANEVIVDLTQERDYLCGQQPQEHCRDLGMSSPERGPNSKDVTLSNGPSSHQSLSCEARSARVYRDEVDSLRERASRVDRLEAELMRCKEKLNDVHFYKTRVEELRDDNQTLMETKVLLEEQLSASRGRCDKLHTLEKDNLLLRAKISDLEMERENERRRLEELVEENMLLEIGQKQSMNESAHLGWELEQLSKNHDSNTETRKSLVHELNECVSSRVLKLEKENRELQTSIERLKEDNHSLQEKQLHAQELDRENQSLSNKLERLQGLLDQERMTNQDMESLGEEILKEKQGVEREMHILKAEKDRQILELESEKKHLSDAMAALQERAQANSEARVREVETENRQLHRKITESSSKLVTMETQLKLANEEVQRVKSKASRCEEVEREAVRLERSRDALNREVTSLHACSERSEALEKQVSSLEQEVHRLKCEAEESQKELHRLGKHESEHSLLAKENLELRCSMENLRSTTARLSSLQEEHQEVQKERQELRRKLEEAQDLAQGEKKRAERLEANMASLNHEKHRLEEDLERQKEEREETERENQEMKSREEELRRELQVQRKHWEETDDERRKLQKDFDQSEKSRKHLEKESWRVRTLLETKEADLEEKSRRLATMQKESVALKKEIDRLKELSVKAKEAERENKELQKQVTIDKRMLATLREVGTELVSEKLNFQQQNVELERLNEELEKIGLNREKLLQQEHTMEDSSFACEYQQVPAAGVPFGGNSPTNDETKRGKNIEFGKETGGEPQFERVSALSELNTVRQTLSLKQEQEQNHNSQKHSGNDRGQGSATAELLRIKDHLIDVEKNNASLQTESSLLKEQLKQLENQNNSLNNQISTLQRHTSTLQEQNSGLHTQTAKLQVENSTLSSQSASLMAQNAVLQGQVTALEAEVESWQRQREEAWKGRESVLSDHERLMNVHERQAHEYEALISQHAALKGKQRALESEHRALHNKYCVLLQQKDIWEKQEGQGQKEKEELSQEVQKNRLLVQENLQLKNEMDRQEAGQWMSRYDSLMEQHQGLDLTMTKLDNHCELLSRLKGNLEEENHHLLSQINLLSQQNHTLLERSMESKELYHQEQKLYIDKLNALRRQKEKLEEKIMDQYKFYDPTPKKKSQWSGAKALAKLIKPRKDTSRERGDREREGFKERERAKSAPDIPLPAPPPLLLPDTPPPVPQRTSSSNDSVQGNSVHGNSVHGNSVHGNSVHGNSVHGNSVHSNSINNTHSSNRLSDRGRAGHRGSTPGDGNENVNGEDSHGQGPSYRALSSTPNHQSSSVGLNSTRSAPSRRPRGLLYDEDLRHTSTDSMFGFHGSAGGRPGSADYSHNTSSSNSPVNCKGSREDLMTDYFTCSPAHSTPIGREQATPTRYVTPTVQPSNQRPGQSVKPSPRHPVGQSPASSQTVTQRTSQSLSRTFSLASADLLRSNGPDGFRGNEGSTGQSDVVIRRPGGGASARERPLSARLAGPTSHGDASFLHTPIHHSSSLNLQSDRYLERGRTTTTTARSGTNYHRGEIAMVTPVRAVTATRLDEDQGGGEGPQKKDGDRTRCSSIERPKSTPASPDPNNDPQTVWYEYGCV